jgi:hypothetical protein
LSATDLQTLLLSVARIRAARVKPADVLRRWREDRFVRPAACDPRAVAAVEARMWRLLPDEIEGVELSPVAPMGTSSAVAPVSQNRVVTTMRSVEVLSDSTNALAVEAADRRLRQGTLSGLLSVHRAARRHRARRVVTGGGARTDTSTASVQPTGKVSGVRMRLRMNAPDSVSTDVPAYVLPAHVPGRNAALLSFASE